MALTILTLVFAATCMADEMKLMKDEIEVIRKLLKDQYERMTRLEADNDALKSAFSKMEKENLLLKDSLVEIYNENSVLKNDVTDLRTQVSQLQGLLEHGNLANLDKQEEEPNGTLRATALHRRLIIHNNGPTTTTPPPVEPVAFYAYMSKSQTTPSNRHNLIFDVLKTNLGTGYNKYSGTFLAPSAGAYVFTWTINTTPHGAHWINLMVNDVAVGGTVSDTQDTADFDSDSNTAVVILNQGDSVHLRTTLPSDRADLFADTHAFTSFAGWRL